MCAEKQHQDPGDPGERAAQQLRPQPARDGDDDAPAHARNREQKRQQPEAPWRLLAEHDPDHTVEHGVVIGFAMQADLPVEADAEQETAPVEELGLQTLDDHAEQHQRQQQREIADEQLGPQAPREIGREHKNQDLGQARRAVGKDPVTGGADEAECQHRRDPEEEAIDRLQNDDREQAEDQQGRVQVDRYPEGRLDRPGDQQDAERVFEGWAQPAGSVDVQGQRPLDQAGSASGWHGSFGSRTGGAGDIAAWARSA